MLWMRKLRHGEIMLRTYYVQHHKYYAEEEAELEFESRWFSPEIPLYNEAISF